EHRHQPAHPGEPEAHPEQLEAQQVALGLDRGPPGPAGSRGARLGHSAVSSASRPAIRSRWAATTAGGALATKPGLASLPAARAISATSSWRRFSWRARWAPRSTPSPARISTDPPGTGTLARAGADPRDRSGAGADPA